MSHCCDTVVVNDVDIAAVGKAPAAFAVTMVVVVVAAAAAAATAATTIVGKI